jgi:DNA-binding IclR family transcriptional regulator
MVNVSAKRKTKARGQGAGSQTLLRGLDVIDALTQGSLTLNDLSERLGLTRSTTHRLASALAERRLLTFRPRAGYSLGPKLIELGYAAGQQMHLPRVARPWLEALSAQTLDTVHLGVLDDRRALYLDKVPGRRRINIGSRLGERHPIASTGLGKALILDMTEADWIGFLNERTKPLDAESRAAWLDRMRTYAESGHACDLEENEDRIRCVAAPIRGVDGTITAAVSLSSAAQYMSDARMAELKDIVRDTAGAISRDLGWTPAPL